MAGPWKPVQREQVRAAVLLGGLLLLALAVWVVAGVTADPGQNEVAVTARPDEVPAADEPTIAGDLGAPADAPDSRDVGGQDSGDARPDPETSISIEFDGMCEVEIDPAEHGEASRPWDFDACTRAPIGLNGSQPRWVVVVASLSGEDFTEREALQRLDGRRRDQQLLWSSHYPSLNPGLWVVIEGPFADKGAAVRAAERIGGGAYPRALSDAASDRYCTTNDGCVGETRSDAPR